MINAKSQWYYLKYKESDCWPPNLVDYWLTRMEGLVSLLNWREIFSSILTLNSQLKKVSVVIYIFLCQDCKFSLTWKKCKSHTLTTMFWRVSNTIQSI